MLRLVKLLCVENLNDKGLYNPCNETRFSTHTGICYRVTLPLHSSHSPKTPQKRVHTETLSKSNESHKLSSEQERLLRHSKLSNTPVISEDSYVSQNSVARPFWPIYWNELLGPHLGYVTRSHYHYTNLTYLNLPQKNPHRHIQVQHTA